MPASPAWTCSGRRDGGAVDLPLLADRTQNTADIASTVADRMGRPLGPATMFTGIAVSFFCPRAMQDLANGNSPIPLDLLNNFGF